jgi:hypothetical protein
MHLWKDADPGIAEVDNARERLTVLKSQKIQLDVIQAQLGTFYKIIFNLKFWRES